MRFLLFLIVLGAAVYLLVRVVQRRGVLARRGRPSAPGPGTVRRPVSPDDDADFLRDIERKRRRRHGEPKADPPPEPAT